MSRRAVTVTTLVAFMAGLLVPSAAVAADAAKQPLDVTLTAPKTADSDSTFGLTLTLPLEVAAFDGRAEMEAVKHGYVENRRILLAGLPKIGFDKILPVDGAFYLYADVSRFCGDSYEFARRMLAETHVAVTPGVDFDPVHGKHFIRLCYAGARAEMEEALERIGKWLS